MLEHDSSALAGVHGVQEVPHQVRDVTSDINTDIPQAHDIPTLQITENPDGDAGVQCLAWSAPGVLSLTRLCPLLSDGEYN